MKGVKLRSMNYDIHAGSIAGMPGRILMFLVSFICAGPPITGFYIWWGRSNKGSGSKKTSTSRSK
ncbi:PepSY domain-containing protein [Paraflavitalea pollutisoli]|uniref:PepSY domain-containing protein n=1 Tax=Paraflavitalea pollutisoli TaxID=3034143 RepID=UPI0023EDA459|nr:PepSY-associated TM helix domain-containing protein [Paraflavitalea sp. H1-2-19X]